MRHAIVLLIALPAAALGQGTQSDYTRADQLPLLYASALYGVPTNPEWADGGPAFWYRVTRTDRTEFVLVDPEKATKRPAFDHAKLADALTAVLGPRVQALGGGAAVIQIHDDDLPFDHVRLAAGKAYFRAVGNAWRFDTATNTLTEAVPPPLPRAPRPHPEARGGQFAAQTVSPDGKWDAYASEHNAFLRNRDTDELVPLSGEGTPKDEYVHEFFWSPDARHVLGFRQTAGDRRKVRLVESAPPDRLLPRSSQYDLPRPGDKLDRRRPVLFDITTQAQTVIDDGAFPDPYELTHFRWDRDGRRFTFVYNPRGHRFLRMVAVDADTGKAKALFTDLTKTFFDYAHKTFVHHLDAAREIVWMSERDGWNHLYLIDADTGATKKQVTKGEWVVRRVDRVDAATRRVWFWAMGVRPGQDVYHQHYCRVNLDGTGLVVLTEGDGTHEVWPTPDRKYFVDKFSRPDKAPVTELRRMDDGKLVLKLEAGDTSEIAPLGWKPPERFVAKGRDGKTDVYGVIFRPSNFDPKKKYPVVENIYSGPTEFSVPKRFDACPAQQQLAELGFIVVMIDGMGTNWRHKAFHDVCHKNLADGGFPDRIAWMKAAAKKHPEMDLSRVGVYGGSAGGRNAVRALIAHNDFYKVAVADCGNHDDRLYHVWYGELWMGHPVGPHYEAQANATRAADVKGKLMLVVGELDRNVDPASTLRLADALIKADKDFEMLVVPGAGHGAADLPYGSRRRADFFVRHLLKAEPRAKP